MQEQQKPWRKFNSYMNGVIKPRDSDKLSHNVKASALEYLMFLKKQRCGKIKGRGCADQCKQCKHTNKAGARSPTVAIEALVLSCIIDGMESGHPRSIHAG